MEIFKLIPNFKLNIRKERVFDNEGPTQYVISNYGRVLSIRCKYKFGGCVLKELTPDKSNKYLYVNIRSSNWTLHTLVKITFDGLPSRKGLEIDHIDGNKQNNHIDNLDWITHAENTRKTFGINKARRSRCPIYLEPGQSYNDWLKKVEIWESENPIKETLIFNPIAPLPSGTSIDIEGAGTFTLDF